MSKRSLGPAASIKAGKEIQRKQRIRHREKVAAKAEREATEQKEQDAV
jgi:hypothetical protein